MWGRRKARAIGRVSKSLLDAGRGVECRSVVSKPTICGKCAPLFEIGRKVVTSRVTLECFIGLTTPATFPVNKCGGVERCDATRRDAMHHVIIG